MYPQLTDLTTYQSQYPRVPVLVTRSVPNFDPANLASYLQQSGDGFALTIRHQQQRYSYFNYAVPTTVTATRDHVNVTTAADTHQIQTNPTAYLQHLLDQYRTPKLAKLPPFTGGLMGAFTYEYAQSLVAKLRSGATTAANSRIYDLMLTTSVLVYDHQRQELSLTRLLPTANLARAYQQAAQELPRELTRVITALKLPRVQPTCQVSAPLTMQQDRATYTERVEQIRQHIVAGDIFQMIFANPHVGTISGSLLPVYQVLNADTAAPYHCYYHHGDFETAVASPETLVTKFGNRIATFPLAGTRRRGRTPDEDARLATELTTSPKELAEHNMLVDLGRNDLGRVAEVNSVHVTRLRQLIRYSQVMHLGSRIDATVAANTSALDVLAATFPAGTLAGAPKIRAMQLIQEFERQPRGIYGGCFGYLEANGDLDMSIGIRLAYRNGAQLVVPSGAGIVADSIGTQEYLECQNKARTVIQAIATATEVRHATAN